MIRMAQNVGTTSHTRSLPLSLHRLVPSTQLTFPITSVLAVATLTSHFPAPPKLHNIPRLFAIRRECVIPEVPVVPAHSADFSRKSSWKFDHYMIIPVVEDLQLKI